MSYCRFLLHILLTLPLISAMAQGQGGVIHSKEMEMKTSVKEVVLERRSDEDFHRLNVVMGIELLNESNTPLIIIENAVQVVGFRLASSKDSLNKRNLMLDNLELPSFKSGVIAEIVSIQSNGVRIFTHGESFQKEFEYWTAVSSTLAETLSTGSTREIWVEFDVSFFPMNTMSIEGEKLKKSWMNDGELLLATFKSKPTKVRVVSEATKSQ